MPKVFKAFRFDPELYAGFRGLASSSGFSVTGAFERFMSVCVENHAVIFPERPSVGDVEAEARILLDWLEKGEYWYHLEREELSIQGRLLTLLPKIHNMELKKNIEEGLKNSVDKSNP